MTRKKPHIRKPKQQNTGRFPARYSVQKDRILEHATENIILGLGAAVIEAWSFYQAAILDRCYKSVDVQLAQWLEETLNCPPIHGNVPEGETLLMHIGKIQNELILKAEQKKSELQTAFRENMNTLRAADSTILGCFTPLDPEITADAVIAFINEQMNDGRSEHLPTFDFQVALARFYFADVGKSENEDSTNHSTTKTTSAAVTEMCGTVCDDMESKSSGATRETVQTNTQQSDHAECAVGMRGADKPTDTIEQPGMSDSENTELSISMTSTDNPTDTMEQPGSDSTERVVGVTITDNLTDMMEQPNKPGSDNTELSVGMTSPDNPTDTIEIPITPDSDCTKSTINMTSSTKPNNTMERLITRGRDSTDVAFEGGTPQSPTDGSFVIDSGRCKETNKVPCDTVLTSDADTAAADPVSITNARHSPAVTAISSEKSLLALPYERRMFTSSPASSIHSTTPPGQLLPAHHYNELMDISVGGGALLGQQNSTPPQYYNPQFTYQTPSLHHYQTQTAYGPYTAHMYCEPTMVYYANYYKYGYYQSCTEAMQAVANPEWNVAYNNVMVSHLPEPLPSYPLTDPKTTYRDVMTDLSQSSSPTPSELRVDDQLAFPVASESGSDSNVSSTTAEKVLPICRTKTRVCHVQLTSASTFNMLEIAEARSQHIVREPLVNATQDMATCGIKARECQVQLTSAMHMNPSDIAVIDSQQGVQEPLESTVMEPAVRISLNTAVVKPKVAGRTHTTKNVHKNRGKIQPVKFMTVQNFDIEQLEPDVEFGWLEQPGFQGVDSKIKWTNKEEAKKVERLEERQVDGATPPKCWANLFHPATASQQDPCDEITKSGQLAVVKAKQTVSRISLERSKKHVRAEDQAQPRDDNSDGWKMVVSKKNRQELKTTSKHKYKQSLPASERQTVQHFKQPSGHLEPCDDQYNCAARIKFFQRKTSICSPWKADRCPYGKECVFAHGKAEQRPLPKLEICKRNLVGRCHAKPNECVYAHSNQELRKAPPNPKSVRPTPTLTSAGGLGGGASGYGQIERKSTRSVVDVAGAECSICSENLHQLNRYKLQCGHDEFHFECINEWINEWAATCPICRRKSAVLGIR